jgi:hypothetical protein
MEGRDPRGEAVRETNRALGAAVSYDVPWRPEETTYRRGAPLPGCGGPWSGWTILVDDRLAPRSNQLEEREPVVIFAAASSHRAITVYEFGREPRPARYAAILWADPPGTFYERVYFEGIESVNAWLETRWRHDRLPRRPRRPRTP